MTITIATDDIDTSGMRFDLSGMIINNPVKVLEEFDWHIPLGTAIVYMEGTNLLKAVITPIAGYKLKADTYPSIGFTVLEKDGNCFKRTKLIYIGICQGKNEDESILSLGEQCPNDPDIIYPAKPAI